ncbi:hypothetical protein YPPY64_1879, partial [Yersinia pestis PY-64]
MAGWG